MSVVGYARVTSGEQTLRQQIDALTDARCKQIFVDEMCGEDFVQPQINLAFSAVRSGDLFLVWRAADLNKQARLESLACFRCVAIETDCVRASSS